MSVHAALFNLYYALGYPSNIEGLCHGFAIRWLEASLLGEEELQRFERRIHYIASMPTEELIAVINHTTAKQGQNLTALDRNILEILSFFDSLALFHMPHRWPAIINNPHIRQHEIENSSPMASSEAIHKKGGLKELHSAALILTEAEIADYLDKLGVLFETSAVLSKDPIALLLGGEDHSIGLTYQPGYGWNCGDINQKLEPPIEKSQLVKAIKKAFEQKNDSFFTAFNVKVLLTKNDPRCEALQAGLQALKITYPITEDVARRRTGTVNLLYIAAKYGLLEEVEALIAAGADLNLTDSKGGNSLTIATINNYDAIIKLLIKNKANLNPVATDNLTPIGFAAYYNNPIIVELLAKAGANLNHRDNRGATPIWLAASKGHAATVEVLVEAEADLAIPNVDGVPPICIAAFNGHTSVIEVFTKYKDDVDLNQTDKDGETPIWLAACNNQPAIIQLLAQEGADVDQVNSNGESPILIAALNGHAAAIEALVKAGASLQADIVIPPPICIAVNKGYIDVVEVLIRAGVDFNQADKSGFTPIWIAADRGHPIIVNQLAQAGADVNSMCGGKTPIFIAAQMGNQSTVEELLLAQADFNIPLRLTVDELQEWARKENYPINQRLHLLCDGKHEMDYVSITPYQIARIMGHFEIAALIKEKYDLQKERPSPAKRKCLNLSSIERQEVTDNKMPLKLKYKQSHKEKRRRPEQAFFAEEGKNNPGIANDEDLGKRLGA
ncbi:ankyrin repeat domain-containing protein [Legionella sp. D16C41]|uniref:ankyrin repeat domain-containing protein n=1 Tax=Legionella sp. D16C41 TaxID=3402688 RepID=UPI003AF46717